MQKNKSSESSMEHSYINYIIQNVTKVSTEYHTVQNTATVTYISSIKKPVLSADHCRETSRSNIYKATQLGIPTILYNQCILSYTISNIRNCKLLANNLNFMMCRDSKSHLYEKP